MDLTISPYIIWIIYFTIGERNVAHVLMTIWFSSQVPCGAGTKIPSKMCSCANRGLISPIITHLTRDICSRFQVWNIYQHLARKSLKCRYSKYTIHGASHYRYLIHYNKYTYIYILNKTHDVDLESTCGPHGCQLSFWRLKMGYINFKPIFSCGKPNNELTHLVEAGKRMIYHDFFKGFHHFQGPGQKKTNKESHAKGEPPNDRCLLVEKT